MDPETIGGRYRLDRRLGEGWFGEVYLARDLNLEYDVAIKLLRKGPDEATSLLREGAYLKALESPYILRVENADIVGDIGYLATQLAVGGSTEDGLSAEGMPPSRVVPVMRQALIGLRACHEHGMIHCDVKPGNIFVGERDHIALGDFGAAGRMNEWGEVKVGGDPKVRAPEMLRGGAGNIRTDIYSAGVTMYRLLTGQWPVDWPGDFNTLHDRVLRSDFDDVSRLSPHLPRSLVRVVRIAMNLNPVDRFASAESMSIALSRVDLGRRWARIAAHPGHVFCWADAPGGVPAREVCVTAIGRRFAITVRRSTGARSRISTLCLDSVTGARLPIELRQIFSTR